VHPTARRPYARRPVPLSQELLALIHASPAPVSVADLTAMVAPGLSHPRRLVWAVLAGLIRGGLVERRGRVRAGLNGTWTTLVGRPLPETR
jgi:hypothetical protein